jgi:hypothetical protein
MQHSSPLKNMTFVVAGYLFVHICEDFRSIVTLFYDFSRGGFLVIVSSAITFVKFFYGLLHIIFQQTTQQYPPRVFIVECVVHDAELN